MRCTTARAWRALQMKDEILLFLTISYFVC
ncbi:hypothetical protein NC653_020282 [Populus alba x Populus x berolinensis]|uniref:Uncharacterized protein n=1 Tax=Populus alba x Populus x berolinensis TaxID=444605 RepID=A0AAD6MKD4_9ROSI|nr:hypothetical protein NC653_020282 [Populus alba x Populus x berolinensis]